MSEETIDLTTFEKVFATGDWKPIRNCPGRFQQIGGRSEIPVENLRKAKILSLNYQPKSFPIRF
jgi:hypothetical protein